MKKGNSFLEKGFLCEGALRNSNRIQKKYAVEFKFLLDANQLFTKITNLLNEKSFPKERVSKILAYKAIQSMQSSIILMKMGINSDTFSLIRTMHECLLAFICLLKDEDTFIEMGNKDDINFRHKRIRDIFTKDILTDMYSGYSETLSTLKEELDKTIGDVKSHKKFGVGDFYKEVSDEAVCQYIYYNYSFISNIHSHVSYASMSNFLSDDKISMNEANADDFRMASRMLIDASMIFSHELSRHFLNNSFDNVINSLIAESYGHLIKVGYLIHKDNVQEIQKKG